MPAYSGNSSIRIGLAKFARGPAIALAMRNVLRFLQKIEQPAARVQELRRRLARRHRRASRRRSAASDHVPIQNLAHHRN
ncbi:MAG: hypothetical protein NTV52_27440 [Acidobacteria bacterium]|nr:hypothetical protein [Acidobacteriota bacterium]